MADISPKQKKMVVGGVVGLVVLIVILGVMGVRPCFFPEPGGPACTPTDKDFLGYTCQSGLWYESWVLITDFGEDPAPFTEFPGSQCD